MQPTQYYSHPALTRYFDDIQSYPSIRLSAKVLSPAYDIVSIDLDQAPKIERKADPPKQKKEKGPAAATPKESTPAPQAEVAPSGDSKKVVPESAKSQKKEKKEKKGANEGGKGKIGAEKGGAAVAAEGSGEPVPSMIDLRVGHIVDGKNSSTVGVSSRFLIQTSGS